MSIVMYDTESNDQFPRGAAAYAAYIDGERGDQPNLAAVRAMFPGAHVLSIALDPAHDADCLDMEPGAAPYSAFPAWAARQRARGVTRPCGYASASPMATELLPVLGAAGVHLGTVRLWSAHTGRGAHICGPATCGEVFVDVDGTQWTFSALGLNLDQSLLRGDFFGTAAPVTIPAWQESMMHALPVVQQPMTGPDVRTVQGLCAARGAVLTIDGVFGVNTRRAVVTVQAGQGLTQDGIVGPLTWPALLALD